jgi:hypothetical protein
MMHGMIGKLQHHQLGLQEARGRCFIVEDKGLVCAARL